MRWKRIAAVDAVLVKTPTSVRELMYGQKLADALGLQPRMNVALDQGGAANISGISIAAMAIEAGQCEVALVCYGDNPRSGDRAVFARPREALRGELPVSLVIQREQGFALARFAPR